MATAAIADVSTTTVGNVEMAIVWLTKIEPREKSPGGTRKGDALNSMKGHVQKGSERKLSERSRANSATQ